MKKFVSQTRLRGIGVADRRGEEPVLEGAAEVMTNEGHGLGEAEEDAMVVRAENWTRFEWRGSMAVGERVSDSPKRVPRYTIQINQMAVHRWLKLKPQTTLWYPH